MTVAVLDTGIAYRNWKQYRQSPDFRGTHFVSPHDFVAKNAYPLDRNGHGTFVAGVIGEQTNNGVALTGLAYGASIMPVRILDGSGLGDEATIAKGIRYAVSHHAQIINLSLEFLPNEVTSASDIPEIVSAINFARARGVMVVGAAGNDQSNQIAFPARTHGVVSVGATTKDLCQADYSNNGATLSLVAPGGGSDAIMPTDPLCHPDRNLPSIYQLTLTSAPHWGRFGYPGYYIGTSMSAPEVSATAALVIASGVIGRHPSPAQLLARLQETATPLGGSRPNPAYGYGIVNAGNATVTYPLISAAGRPNASGRPRPPGPDSGHRRGPASGSGRADDHHRAGRVVRDLVGDRPEQEPRRAGHPLVADHDQIRALLLGDIDDRVGRVPDPRDGVDLGHAGAPRLIGGGLQQGEHVLTRVDRPLHVGGGGQRAPCAGAPRAPVRRR